MGTQLSWGLGDADWVDLSNSQKSAAEALSYTEKSWNLDDADWGHPSTGPNQLWARNLGYTETSWILDDADWNDLTSSQKSAAGQLDYTGDIWDNEDATCDAVQ